MPLCAITYISRAPEVRGEQRRLFLSSLVKAADARNQPHGVSGCLIHVDDFFIHVLEGSRGPLSQTYHRIAVDPRHSDVQLVQAGPIISRQFTQTSLAAFDSASHSNPVFQKYRVRPEFCPYQMAPHALADLIDQIALVCAKMDATNRRGKDGTSSMKAA